MQSHKEIKVCHLTSVHGPYDTRIFLKECVSLSDYFDTYLIAPANKLNHSEKVTIIPLWKKSNRLFRFFITDVQLLFKALFLNARIYHFHDPELIPVGLILSFFGKKVIYDIHEHVHLDLKEKNWLPFKNTTQKIYKIIEKYASKQMHFVLANASMQEYYQELYAQYTLLQNFVLSDKLIKCRTHKPDSLDTILLVGHLSARRGLGQILDALYVLKLKGIKINLICVGKEDVALEELLREHPIYQNVKEQVVFKGFMRLEEAYKEAKTCFAGMAILEDLANHRLNYPTKLFEYMSVGLPVIISNFPLYDAVIEQHKCGISVNPNVVEEIADAIEYLYKNPAEAKKMGLNGQNAIDEGHYNWETEKTKLLNLYNSLL